MPASTSFTSRAPKLCIHKPTGQAFIFVGGHRVYLGRHDRPETTQKYHQVVAEMLASGGLPAPEPQMLTVKELVSRFWVWAENYYINPDGALSAETLKFQRAFKPLCELYADTPAVSFGPRALQAVRQKMIELGWCRTSINKHVQLIKTLFRWGTEQELLSGEVYHALQAVAGLRRGRTNAQESAPVRPVPIEHVNAIKPFVSRQVWAIIQLQLLTAARAGELVGLRPCDIDRSGKVWTFVPDEHKTAHHGHRRTIYFGPKAQEVLAPFLLRPAEQHLFSPAEAEAERRRERHARRKTPLSCGNRPGSNRAASPKRSPGDVYDVAAYRRAIDRGCDLADKVAKAAREGKDGDADVRLVPHWHPHQLRHTAATELRKEFGLEAARVILGHRSASITEVYAELDRAKALDTILKVG